MSSVDQYIEKQGYLLLETPLEDTPALSLPEGIIAIDPLQAGTTAERNAQKSHEVGHIETGTFYTQETPEVERDRCEERARRRSYQIGISAGELTRLLEDGRDLEELAGHFEFPEDFVLEALRYYQDSGAVPPPGNPDDGSAPRPAEEAPPPAVRPTPPEEGASLTGYGLTPPGRVRLTPALKSHFAACLAQIKAFGGLTRETRIRFAADRLGLGYTTAEALMEWYERAYPAPKKEAPPKADDAPKSRGMKPGLSRTLTKRSIDIWK